MMASSPSETIKMSSPAPPSRMSSPAPPSRVSAPAPPRSVSSPSPPSRISAPAFPRRTLSPTSPVKPSAPEPPVIFSKSVKVSVPVPWPSAVPASRSTFTPRASLSKEIVSFPLPPAILSSPAPPSTTSFPRPEEIKLSNASPVITSLPTPVAMFSTPEIVSLPVSEPEMVPAVRSTVVAEVASSKDAVSTPSPPIIVSSPALAAN